MDLERDSVWSWLGGIAVAVAFVAAADLLLHGLRYLAGS